MPDFTVPEIQRTSLTAVILTLKCLGVHDVIRYTDNQSVTSIHSCSLYFYTNQLIFFFFKGSPIWIARRSASSSRH